MVEINEQLSLRQYEIDRIKTQLATPTVRAARTGERAELFRELVSVRLEYGMLLRITRSRRSLISKIATS